MNQTTYKPIALIFIFVLMVAGFSNASEKYKLDPDHSSIIFKVKHFDIGYVYGRFNDFSGHFVIDPKNPTKSSVEITVKAASVDTNNQKRDQHLRSPDFLNAKQFQLITFKGAGVKKIDDHTAEVRGTLTLHGVPKPFTIKVERVGQGKDPWGNQRIGLKTSLSIKRSDFGINYMPEGISDEIRVKIATEGIVEK